ncbi:MAG: type IV pilus twitching motility protein PilT [Clostridia bacterium]|nr:type IV pilus twitching motility protein PilT [Clostridia bacterium]
MNLNHLLEKTILYKASDLHICTGLPPVIRLHGDLIYMDEPNLTPQDCENLAKQCLTSRSYEILEDKGEIDLSYMLPAVARFRINVFKQRGTLALAVRVIPTETPKLGDLGLPGILNNLAERQRGLVLVTGPTGSGKSTTLAAIIDYINSKRRCHIVTIEDPIEFLHKHEKSVINQREVGSDTNNFANALRAVLREDPDVILVGEMRDKETIETALTAAETGHLVFSTLHTLGAAKTIDRIIDVFPPHQQQQVRSQLSTVLQSVISQQLIKKADGKGRVVATEVMVWTPAIANLIREGRTPQINTSIHTGSQFGMHSMDSCIAELFKAKQISFESANQYAIDQENFKKLLVG